MRPSCLRYRRLSVGAWASHHQAARLVVALTVLVACARPDENLGPPDSYALFAPPAEGGAATVDQLPLVERVAPGERRTAPIVRSLSEGFGAELLRSLYLCKQYIRQTPGTSPEAREAASRATLILLDREGPSAVGRGLAFSRFLGADVLRPDLSWVGLPRGLEEHAAITQSVAAAVATHLAEIAASGGTMGSSSEGSRILVEGYRMSMEVIAREWKTGRGPAASIKPDVGSPAQRALFNDVRENRFVLGGAAATLPSAEALLREPGVVATILYRLAQARDVGRRLAPERFYSPFVEGRVPPGIKPASILGPFQNFQVKLLGVWMQAARAGRPPRDIVDLLSAYGETFPDERRAVIWTFLATTFGATVKPGGVSVDAKSASASPAELEALADEILAGRRTLRDAQDAAGQRR